MQYVLLVRDVLLCLLRDLHVQKYRVLSNAVITNISAQKLVLNAKSPDIYQAWTNENTLPLNLICAARPDGLLSVSAAPLLAGIKYTVL